MNKYLRIKQLVSEGIPEAEARKIVKAEIVQQELDRLYRQCHDWRIQRLIRIVSIINVK